MKEIESKKLKELTRYWGAIFYGDSYKSRLMLPSTRVVNALYTLGINTPEDLKRLNLEDLGKLKNCGPKTIRDIREYASEMGHISHSLLSFRLAIENFGIDRVNQLILDALCNLTREYQEAYFGKGLVRVRVILDRGDKVSRKGDSLIERAITSSYVGQVLDRSYEQGLIERINAYSFRIKDRFDCVLSSDVALKSDCATKDEKVLMELSHFYRAKL